MNFGNLDVQDIKSAFNKVKAAVLNLSELEQKVREATSNEAWGASSSHMNELAKATFDYQGFNEIMPSIYKRFSQEGRTWRNIYKSLTLIEYLIKNGSEKVIDYVRAHSYELKACLNYHFTDEKGKDQGINIRHRAKLILDLLQNDELIQMERQKAADNKAKYGGVGSDGSRSGGFGNNSNSRYGGFSSSDYEGGSYSNSSASGYAGFAGSYSISNSTSPTFNFTNTSPTASVPPVVTAAPPKPTVVDLLGFDDDPIPPPSTVNQANKGNIASDDEWGDFTSANAAPNNTSITSTPVSVTGFGAVFPTAPNAQTKPTHTNTNAVFENDFADFVSAPGSSSIPQTSKSNFANFGGTMSPSNTEVPNLLLMGDSPIKSNGASHPLQMPLGGLTSPGNSMYTTTTTTMSSIGITSWSNTAGGATQPPKITASTPLSQLMGSNLVDLDSLAMLGAKATPSSGPSMNSMIASGTTMGSMVPMVNTGATSGTGSQPASFLGSNTTGGPSSSFTPQSQVSSQQQQQFGAFNSGSLI